MHIEKKKNSPRRPYISPKEPIIITPCFSGMHCRKLFNIIGLFLAMVHTVSLKLFYSVTEQWSTDGKRTVPVGPHNISGLTVISALSTVKKYTLLLGIALFFHYFQLNFIVSLQYLVVISSLYMFFISIVYLYFSSFFNWRLIDVHFDSWYFFRLNVLLCVIVIISSVYSACWVKMKTIWFSKEISVQSVQVISRSR